MISILQQRFDPSALMLIGLAVAVPGRVLAPATSRFGRLGGLVFALLKPIDRPPLPALGHSGNRKQPLDFIAITRIDAKEVPDGETMSRLLDYPDLITRS
jgi:hypothetical protein